MKGDDGCGNVTEKRRNTQWGLTASVQCDGMDTNFDIEGISIITFSPCVDVAACIELTPCRSVIRHAEIERAADRPQPFLTRFALV